MSVHTMGVTLDEQDSIMLSTSRAEESAWLQLDAGGAHCEIRLDRVHVETLRDQLPDVLAGLDRWRAEDAGCQKAAIAERRAVDAAAKALDAASAADAAGAHELATSLRAAVADTTARATAVDAAVQAYEDATTDADSAADKLIYAIHKADEALRRPLADGRPAGLNTVVG